MVDQKREAQLRDAIENFYFAYRAFTARPDRILEQRGLGRVHHRVLYFVGTQPGLSVNELLSTLGVSKQALNAPLRQLIEMKLVATSTASHDKRVKQLSLTEAGKKLETQLTQTQMKHLHDVFDEHGTKAERAWLALMKSMPSQEK
ncbi:MAG TPA: MarR family transcriptional regulator [Steroidobacteraceae bacterium]|jgi:DNA-binding MarR family transcriptional regulator|nr:MarR family transcriptional regulator [Steroidobacteraceae bacterium]